MPTLVRSVAVRSRTPTEFSNVSNPSASSRAAPSALDLFLRAASHINLASFTDRPSSKNTRGTQINRLLPRSAVSRSASTSHDSNTFSARLMGSPRSDLAESNQVALLHVLPKLVTPIPQPDYAPQPGSSAQAIHSQPKRTLWWHTQPAHEQVTGQAAPAASAGRNAKGKAALRTEPMAIDHSTASGSPKSSNFSKVKKRACDLEHELLEYADDRHTHRPQTSRSTTQYRGYYEDYGPADSPTSPTWVAPPAPRLAIPQDHPRPSKLFRPNYYTWPSRPRSVPMLPAARSPTIPPPSRLTRMLSQTFLPPTSLLRLPLRAPANLLGAFSHVPLLQLPLSPMTMSLFGPTMLLPSTKSSPPSPCPPWGSSSAVLCSPPSRFTATVRTRRTPSTSLMTRSRPRWTRTTWSASSPRSSRW